MPNTKIKDYGAVIDGKPVSIVITKDQHISVIAKDLRKGEMRWRFTPDMEPESIQVGAKDQVNSVRYTFRLSGEKVFVTSKKKNETESPEQPLSAQDLKSKNDSNFHTFAKALAAIKNVAALQREYGTEIEAASKYFQGTSKSR